MEQDPHHTATTPDSAQPTDSTMSDQIRKNRELHYNWSRRCWGIGGLAIIVGILCLNFAEAHFVQSNSTAGPALHLIALSLISVGAIVIVIGPHFWFWRRHSGR